MAFKAGVNGVVSVKTIADRKVEFITLKEGGTPALVKSTMGYSAYSRCTM